MDPIKFRTSGGDAKGNLDDLKVHTARQIKSRSLLADSKQTLGCILLSIALLVGLVANVLFGVWGIDSAAALLIAGLLIREGAKTLKEKDFCCS